MLDVEVLYLINNSDSTNIVKIRNELIVNETIKKILNQTCLKFLTTLDGTPDVLMMNTKMAAKMRAVARRAGMYQVTKDDFGRQVEYYGNIPFVDLGAKAGSNDPIVATDAEGKTSIYAVRFGMDGFHAISLTGEAPVQMWLPDFSTAGAVKKGEVEMVAGCALKSTKAAGVFRGIKVQ